MTEAASKEKKKDDRFIIHVSNREQLEDYLQRLELLEAAYKIDPNSKHSNDSNKCELSMMVEETPVCSDNIVVVDGDPDPRIKLLTITPLKGRIDSISAIKCKEQRYIPKGVMLHGTPIEAKIYIEGTFYHVKFYTKEYEIFLRELRLRKKGSKQEIYSWSLSDFKTSPGPGTLGYNTAARIEEYMKEGFPLAFFDSVKIWGDKSCEYDYDVIIANPKLEKAKPNRKSRKTAAEEEDDSPIISHSMRITFNDLYDRGN